MTLGLTERQKASRLVKQLEEKLKTATDPEEKARLQADLHIARVDVNYAKYHPFMEKYVSLYPKTKDKQNEEGSGAAETAGNGAGSKQKPSSGSSAARHLHDERPPLWKEVEQAMMEGEEALLRLQERRPNRSRTVPPAPSKAPSKEKHGGAVQKKKEASGTAREPRHVEGEEQQQEQRQARPQRPQSTTPPATTRSKGSAANAVPLNGNRAARRAALRKKFYEDGLRPGYGDDKGTSGDDSDFFED